MLFAWCIHVQQAIYSSLAIDLFACRRKYGFLRHHNLTLCMKASDTQTFSLKQQGQVMKFDDMLCSVHLNDLCKGIQAPELVYSWSGHSRTIYSADLSALDYPRSFCVCSYSSLRQQKRVFIVDISHKISTFVHACIFCVQSTRQIGSTGSYSLPWDGSLVYYTAIIIFG